jgi:hypothetical protein
MDFYYRSLPDGRCEVVCTRCFITVGTAWNIEHIRRIEGSHTCLAKRPAVSRPKPAESEVPQVAARVAKVSSDFNKPSKSRVARSVTLLCLVAALFYAFPKTLEFSALQKWNPWISVVLPGDLAGCLCLAIVFRKMKAGILLYLLLSAAEACLYWLDLTPADVLPWIADLVPTVVISLMVLGPAGRTGKLLPMS